MKITDLQNGDILTEEEYKQYFPKSDVIMSTSDRDFHPRNLGTKPLRTFWEGVLAGMLFTILGVALIVMFLAYQAGILVPFQV